MFRILLPLLLLISISAEAQFVDTVYQYFDSEWKKVDEKDDFDFFRIAKKTEGGVWLVRDYYRDARTLKMEGSFLDDALTIQDGKARYYYYEGSLQAECSYNKGKPVGLYRAYSFDGALIDSSRFRANGMPFHKSFMWDEDGRIITYGDYDMKGTGTGYLTSYYTDSTVSSFGKVVNGSTKDSVWTYYRTDGKPALVERYDAGNLLQSICYDSIGNETTGCDTARRVPKPNYNAKLFLVKNVNFPQQVLEDGLSGKYKVVVSFWVNIDGSIKVRGVEQGSHGAFTQEAIRVVSSMPKWEPGWHKNRPLRMYFSMPVSFRIE